MSTPLSLCQVMSVRRLELAFVANVFDQQCVACCVKAPESWQLLGDHLLDDVEEIDEIPGWRLRPFFVRLEAWHRQLAECYGAMSIAGEWWYAVRGLDHSEGFLSAGVVVREVPACIVFNCELRDLHQARQFQAIFTTLSGTPVMRLQEDMPPFLTGGHLIRHIRETAEAMGYLRSQNQKLSVLMNGGVEELQENTLLYHKPSEIRSL